MDSQTICPGLLMLGHNHLNSGHKVSGIRMFTEGCRFREYFSGLHFDTRLREDLLVYLVNLAS